MPGRPSGGGDRFIAVRAVVKCPITPRSTPALLPFTGEGGAKRRMRGASAAKRDLDLPQEPASARALSALRHFLPPREEGQGWEERGVRPLGKFGRAHVGILATIRQLVARLLLKQKNNYSSSVCMLLHVSSITD